MTLTKEISLEESVRKVFSCYSGSIVGRQQTCDIRGFTLMYDAERQQADFELHAEPHPYYITLSIKNLQQMKNWMIFLAGRGYNPEPQPKLTDENGRTQVRYKFSVKRQTDLTRLCLNLHQMFEATGG